MKIIEYKKYLIAVGFVVLGVVIGLGYTARFGVPLQLSALSSSANMSAGGNSCSESLAKLQRVMDYYAANPGVRQNRGIIRTLLADIAEDCV